MMAKLYKPMGIATPLDASGCTPIQRITNMNAHFQRAPVLPNGLMGLQTQSTSTRDLVSASHIPPSGPTQVANIPSPLAMPPREQEVEAIAAPTSSSSIAEGAPHAKRRKETADLELPQLRIFNKSKNDSGYRRVEIIEFYERWIGNGVNPPLRDTVTASKGSSFQKQFSKISVPCRKIDVAIKNVMETDQGIAMLEGDAKRAAAQKKVVDAVQALFVRSNNQFPQFVKDVMGKSSWKIEM